MKIGSGLRNVFLSFCFALLCHPVIYGQDFEKNKPRELEPDASAPLPEYKPSAIPLKGDKEKVLVKALKGITVFAPKEVTGKQNAIVSFPAVVGINVVDIPLLDNDSFRERLSPFLGEPLNLALVQEIGGEVLEYFREQNRPVVKVFLPQQDITEGQIIIAALESAIGELRGEGAGHFDNDKIVGMFRAGAGDFIRTDTLQDDLTWANRNPFREVELIFTPGAAYATTDVIVRTHDRIPLRGFASYENTGTPSTSLDRWLAGFQWGNVWGLDHQFSYQYTTGGELDELSIHTATYRMPLPWRHELLLFGSHAETLVPDPNVVLKGKSWQVGVRYDPLLKARGKWNQSLSMGVDFKRSNNNLEFGGTSIQNTETDVLQATVNYQGSLRDKFGYTGCSLTMNYSPGNLTKNNEDQFFNASRRRAEADYYYANININRITKLPGNMSLRNNLVLQFANTNLIASEQFGLGGVDTVRGYDYRDVSSDEGYLFRTEIIGPPLDLAWDWPGLEWRWGETDTIERLQFLTFFDYGVGKNIDLIPGERSKNILSSVGVGARYSFGAYVTMNIDYGWQLREINRRVHNSRLHFSLNVAY